MQNFSFEHDGETFWYSRSVVSSAYVYCRCKRQWYILCAQRGPGSTMTGMWNVPGGFLDHGESTQQAAQREAYEETGVIFPAYGLRLVDVNSIPSGSRQHIRFSYVYNMGDVKKLPELNTHHIEENEVSRVGWVSIKSLHQYPEQKKAWINDQYQNILSFYKLYIHPNIWQRIKNKLSNSIDHNQYTIKK